jgi:hypothetical protein
MHELVCGFEEPVIPGIVQRFNKVVPDLLHMLTPLLK